MVACREMPSFMIQDFLEGEMRAKLEKSAGAAL